MMPKDPVMLLSYGNLKRRDLYTNRDALCEYFDADRIEMVEDLAGMDYHCDEEKKQFG